MGESDNQRRLLIHRFFLGDTHVGASIQRPSRKLRVQLRAAVARGRHVRLDRLLRGVLPPVPGALRRVPELPAQGRPGGAAGAVYIKRSRQSFLFGCCGRGRRVARGGVFSFVVSLHATASSLPSRLL